MAKSITVPNKLFINENVPKWAIKWAVACKELILPEWEVEIEVSDPEADGCPDALAMVIYRKEYLTAVIQLGNKLQNNPEGHYSIVHEFCHPVLCEYNNLTELLFNMGYGNRVQSEYDAMKPHVEELRRTADEHATTKMARSITALLEERFTK